MSSKRKSPPTKLEGGCQPTTTTTNTAHINLANFNQKSSNLDKDGTHLKHSDSEHFDVQDIDCDIGDELTPDIDNNDHNNNDDDANDHCDGVNANTLSSDGFDGKTSNIISISLFIPLNFLEFLVTPIVIEASIEKYFFLLFAAKNVLSCIQAKLDSIKAKLTSEKHQQGGNIDKRNARQSIDERNNNSDYEEPCKRPKIDLGSCSPIHSVS